MIDDLRKNEFACVHVLVPPALRQEHKGLAFQVSSR
jgi:hypothetical protein